MRRKVVAGLLALALLVAGFASFGANLADASPSSTSSSSTSPYFEEIFPGDLEGPYREKYLFEDHGSRVEKEVPRIGSYAPTTVHFPRPWATKRWADGNDWFSYRIPVAKEALGPLTLTMITKGELVVTLNKDTKILDTGNSGEGDYTVREFLLDDPSMWSTGYVTVKFRDADPSDGWGPNLYDLELGTSSTLRKRIEALWWNSRLEWNVGLPDGFGNEFQGKKNFLKVGEDYTALTENGKITLSWDQSIDPNRRYILLAGAQARTIGGWRHGRGNVILDVGDDGTPEADRNVKAHRVVDIDVTSQLRKSGNKVSVAVTDDAVRDFVALVSVPSDTSMDPEGLRVKFGGNAQADAFTKLANTSMFFTLNMLNDKNSGFVDSSMTNGMFANTLFIADVGPAALELLHYGELDRVREILNYTQPDSSGHYDQDIAAGNQLFAAMLGLLRADNYSQESLDKYWPVIRSGMNRLVNMIEESPQNLVEGLNWETSGMSQSIYASATSYYVLLSAVEAAKVSGNVDDGKRWQESAVKLREGMLKSLVWRSGESWDGRQMRAGTWKYGVRKDGSMPKTPFAAWHSVGAAKDLYYGLEGDDPVMREISDLTLDFHQRTFWPDWSRSGHVCGFGTSYGVLSERGGWPLNSMLQGDRIGDATRNINHVTFNSYDHNFLPYGKNPSIGWDNEADYAEWSPNLIVREVNADDRGSDPKLGCPPGDGNGVGSEDLNLVEYILFLKNSRIIVGLDDQLEAGSQVTVAPRLPLGWKTAQVREWPVTVRDEGAMKRAKMSYSYELSSLRARMTASADTSVNDVKVRLGPFASTSVVQGARVNGQPVHTAEEARGDSRWVWVTVPRIDTQESTIEVDMSDSNLQASPSMSSVNDWAITGGSWDAADERSGIVHTAGDAWATAPGGSGADVRVSAEASLDSGNAVGLFARSNGAGTTGYEFIIDRVDSKAKLVKRPYKVLASQAMTVNLERPYLLELMVQGDEVIGRIDGVEILRTVDTTYASGESGLFAYSSTARFTDPAIHKLPTPLLVKDVQEQQVGSWSVNAGKWTGTSQWITVAASGDAWALIPSSEASESRLVADVTLVSGNAVGLSSRVRGFGSSGYDLILDDVDGLVKLSKRPYKVLDAEPFNVVPGRKYRLELVSEGDTLKGFVDGVERVRAVDSTYSSGSLALFAYKSAAKFEKVEIREK